MNLVCRVALAAIVVAGMPAAAAPGRSRRAADPQQTPDQQQKPEEQPLKYEETVVERLPH